MKGLMQRWRNSRDITSLALSSLLAVVLCGVALGACGGANRNDVSSRVASNSTAPATLAGRLVSDPASHPKSKSDNDGDGDGGDDDNNWGRAASAADRRAVATLLERYYILAVADDGGADCALIYSLLAEEVPELYGEPPGPPSLRGDTCQAVVSKLFREKHRQLVADSATLEVIGVRVKRLRGLALLHFRGSPERDIPVHLEHGVWRVDALLDGAIG